MVKRRFAYRECSETTYNRRMRFKYLFPLLLILSACSFPGTSNNDVQIQQAVAATLASIPTGAPAPLSTPYPTPTPFDLRGLFCEYQFCMGHPVDMAFFDVSAQNNPASPSTYSQGLIAAFNGNLFIQMIWQLSPGTADPQFMLDLVVDKEVDTRVGQLDVKLIRDMNVIYTPITTTASPILPYGASAAWTCGDRVFGWKTYTPDEGSAQALFDSAFSRFNCNR